MGEGSTVTAVYEIIPVSNSNNEVDIDTLRYERERMVENPNIGTELAFLKLRYKEPNGKKSKEIVQPIGIAKNGEMDPQFQFVSAVIEFGMVLRDSEFKGASSLDQVLELAKNGSMGEKDGEYSEFIKLVGLAKELKQ
jgi:Ca-activated chloride channel family protein